MEHDSEVQRLDEVAGRYDPSDPTEEFDYHLKRLQARAITPWLTGGRTLEMGCATGELTSLLCHGSREYHVVEGSRHNIDAAAARNPTVAFHHSLWEDFEPEAPFDDILLVCALEHVEDPVAIVRRAAGWLTGGGRMHIVVPNADSLHRFVGVEMGILHSRRELSASDERIGHRRVYDIDDLRADVVAGGLTPIHWQGIFLKVLSNAQMIGWDPALIEALDRVGQRLPSFCAELYLVARRT